MDAGLADQLRELYACNCPSCAAGGSTHPVNAAGDPPDAEWEDIIQRVFDGEISAGMIDVPTATRAARELMEGVVTGFRASFDTIDYTSPDYGMLADLERSVYQFSGAKNYQELKELTRMLKDGDRLRSFTEYRREALKVVDEWNNVWKQTEYDTAIQSAIHARKWNDFEAVKDIMPNLRYRTVGDARVREAHRLLDGVVRPLGDAFWNTYYPPNGFKCRCTVLQVGGEREITPDEQLNYPEVPTMFMTNLAKDGLIFPKDHPYYKGCPKKLLNKFVNENAPERKK